MKIAVIIVSLLILQTSASFFDSFRGAFMSVENNFGQLLNDVVSDVKINLDCTILAVQQVLCLGGMFRDESEYETKCKGQKDASSGQAIYTPKTKQNVVGIKDISKEIDTSISNVNRTLNNFLAKRDAQNKIESVKNVLKNETDRLAEISALLSRELDNISANLKKEFKKFDLGTKKPTVEDVVNEVQILYELEKMEEDTSEAKEIRHVFDEVLDVLHTNNSKSLSNDEEFKEIMTNLEITSNKTFSNIEGQFSQWKDGEKKHIDEMKTVVANQHPTDDAKITNFSKNIDVPEKVDDFPLNFKDVFKKILDDPNSSNRDHGEDSSDKISRAADSAPDNSEFSFGADGLPHEGHEVKPSDANDKSVATDYLLPKTTEAHEKAVKDAQDLMEQSRLTQMFMDSLYSKADKSSAVNVFDNPELLNFG